MYELASVVSKDWGSEQAAGARATPSISPPFSRKSSTSDHGGISAGGSSSSSSSSSTNSNSGASYLPILTVLFLEFLSISLAKSLIPLMLVEAFGDYTYVVVGVVETLKGLLAFVACPAFGRLSDRMGRKPCLVRATLPAMCARCYVLVYACLFARIHTNPQLPLSPSSHMATHCTPTLQLVTVVGTTLPVCMLAFTTSMHLHVFLLAVSGLFSATFPLTFAYISDCVDKKERAPAYGLALATFGLSFSLGPLTGSYIARAVDIHAVFGLSLLLVAVNVAYIILYLPETVDVTDLLDGGDWEQGVSVEGGAAAVVSVLAGADAGADAGAGARIPPPQRSWRSRVRQVFHYLPNTWDAHSTFRGTCVSLFVRVSVSLPLSLSLCVSVCVPCGLQH